MVNKLRFSALKINYFLYFYTELFSMVDGILES